MLLKKPPKVSEATNHILKEEEVENVHLQCTTVLIQIWVEMLLKRPVVPLSPGLDGDWCRILMSGNFGLSEKDLRQAIADMTKRLCQYNIVKYLEAFLVGMLITLDKQPGARPIRRGAVLSGFIGKIVIKLLKKDVLKATESLQLCKMQAGQNAGREAAVHDVHAQ